MQFSFDNGEIDIEKQRMDVLRLHRRLHKPW